jgi:hypothetical protein
MNNLEQKDEGLSGWINGRPSHKNSSTKRNSHMPLMLRLPYICELAILLVQVSGAPDPKLLDCVWRFSTKKPLLTTFRICGRTPRILVTSSNYAWHQRTRSFHCRPGTESFHELPSPIISLQPLATEPCRFERLAEHQACILW